MATLKTLVMLSVSALLMMGSAAYAEDAAKPDHPPGMMGEHHGEMRDEMRGEMRGEMREEMRKKFEAMTPEEKEVFKQKMEERRKEMKAKFEAMTPEQKKEFREKREERREEFRKNHPGLGKGMDKDKDGGEHHEPPHDEHHPQ